MSRRRSSLARCGLRGRENHLRHVRVRALPGGARVQLDGSAPELKGTWHPKSVSHRLDGGAGDRVSGREGEGGLTHRRAESAALNMALNGGVQQNPSAANLAVTPCKNSCHAAGVRAVAVPRRRDAKDAPGIRPEKTTLFIGLNGARRRIRTTDTRIFNPLLYQLSYPGAERLASDRRVVMAGPLRCPEPKTTFSRFPVIIWNRFGGNAVVAAQPMRQVHIRAAARAEGAIPLGGGLAADRAFHALSSGRARRDSGTRSRLRLIS